MNRHIGSTRVLIWEMFYPLLLYQLVSGMVFSTCQMMGYEAGESRRLLLTGISAGIAILPLGMIYYRNSAQKVHIQKLCAKYDGRLNGRSDTRTGLLAASAAAGTGACLVFNYVISMIPIASAAKQNVQQMVYSSSYLIQIVCTGFVIPLAEELVFRGQAYRKLRERLPFSAAALISALYFGLFHGELIQGIYAFLLGFLLAWLYERSRSLPVVWMFHAAANITSIGFTVLIRPSGAFRYSFEFAAACAGMGLMILSFYRIREVTEYEITFHSDSLLQFRKLYETLHRISASGRRRGGNPDR